MTRIFIYSYKDVTSMRFDKVFQVREFKTTEIFNFGVENDYVTVQRFPIALKLYRFVRNGFKDKFVPALNQRVKKNCKFRFVLEII